MNKILYLFVESLFLESQGLDDVDVGVEHDADHGEDEDVDHGVVLEVNHLLHSLVLYVRVREAEASLRQRQRENHYHRVAHSETEKSRVYAVSNEQLHTLVRIKGTNEVNSS